MVPEITDKHREIFKSLASGWMRIGATCVQLTQGNEVLIGCPNSVSSSMPALSASSRTSGLSLQVYGVADLRWAPSAESCWTCLLVCLQQTATSIV